MSSYQWHHWRYQQRRVPRIALSETILALVHSGQENVDIALIRVLSRTIGFLLGIVIFLSGVNQLGIDVMPLVAGIGVGGLAVALAVRPTLENMIEGLILYADKPVKVGDLCKFGSDTGFVETIGLRFAQCIEAAGTSVAFPSTTVYMGKDSGLDSDNIARAEAKVDTWRKTGELPFPDEAEPVVDRLNDTTIYPPRGSYHYGPYDKKTTTEEN